MRNNFKKMSQEIAVLFCCLLMTFFCSQAIGAELAPVPKFDYVADTASLFTPSEKQALWNKIAAFEKKTGSQVSVVVVPSLNGETIESYAHRVGAEWKLGRKGIGDGLIIFIAPKEKMVRIDVMRDLEGAIPDVMANRVLEEDIIPNFADGNYYEGIDKGLDSVFKLIESENLPPPVAATTDKDKNKKSSPNQYANESKDVEESGFISIESIFTFILMGLGIALTLRQVIGTKAAPISAFLIGIVGWIIFGSLIVAVIVGVLSLLFSLFVPNSVLEASARRAAQLNRMQSFGRRSRYTSPFGGFGGFGKLGGFGRGISRGGFKGPISGGGGRSAGGGASGRW